MKYLLDTHVLLWAFSDFEKLPPLVQSILQNAENTIYVSSVSIWEISIKKSLGKLDCPNDLIEMIYKKQFQSLDINFFHAQKVDSLKPFHNDPFDRLLIAQSCIENIPLITKNSIMPLYDVEVIWE